MERDLRAAAAATALWLAVGAGLDVALVHHNRRPMTHVLRCPLGAVGFAVLAAHLLDLLGPLDPFCAVGRCIPRRSAP